MVGDGYNLVLLTRLRDLVKIVQHAWIYPQ